MKSISEKFNTVISKNTFYYYDAEFEQSYEGYITSLKETLLVLKNKVVTDGLRKELFEDLILHKENGLKALLALTGISNESFKRLITFIRIVNDIELNSLVFKDKWNLTENAEQITEWSDEKIINTIRGNDYFRKGLINIFFEGSTLPILTNAIPLFELKKLSISKLNFDAEAMIDTLVRYKEKGSYSGKRCNNPEVLLEKFLDKHRIPFEKGDLSELIKIASDTKRTMDFIIPDKNKPKLIIESSFLVTTSSGQGDKSKTEISIDKLIKKHYRNARFIGFIDGIGWYVRKGDLKRMVSAYEDVFTYHKDELERFEKLLINIFGQ